MSASPIILMLVLTTAAFGSIARAADTADLASPAENALMTRVQNAGLATQRHSWEQGILEQAFLEEGNDAMVVAMARASLLYQNRDGLAAAIGGAPVDPLMGGEAMWRAGQMTHDPALVRSAQRMLDWTLNKAPRAADGTIYHTGEAVWADSFNTAAPFLAATGHYDEAIQQIEGMRKRLWDPDHKLLSHMWDEKKQQFTRKAAWGGGSGWAACGIARVIRALPADRAADRARLTGYLKEILDGCLAHQRQDGLFNNIVDDSNSFEEVDMAQMLAFAIYTGIQGDWLPHSYAAAADRMEKAARARVDSNGFVQGVAGAPDFNHPGISPEGQAFFLMMEAARAKLKRRAA